MTSSTDVLQKHQFDLQRVSLKEQVSFSMSVGTEERGSERDDKKRKLTEVTKSTHIVPSLPTVAPGSRRKPRMSKRAKEAAKVSGGRGH